MKKAIPIIALVTIFLAICYSPSVNAQTETHIIINFDGTVTPSTAPIQQDEDTYTLTNSYEGTLLIQKSNIVLNGAGNFIQSLDRVRYCLKIDSVSNVTVKNLVVRGASFGCMYGIELVGASNCLITNNTVTDVWSIMALNAINFDGIHVEGGTSNVFTKNTLANNLLGMHFGNTVNNLIVENSIDYTSQGINHVPSGISFHNASGNLIYHNTFRAEGTQVGSYRSNNTWDNGFPNGGNCWSDYQSHNPNPQKINNTQLYDVPYIIDEQNIDHYPLAEPYSATTPIISILSKEDSYNVSSIPLNFTVDQTVAWMGYSLDGAQNVTLSGNQTLTDLGNGQHTVMVYANDSFGNMGLAEFQFTVFVLDFTPTVVVVAVALLVVGGVVYYRRHKKKA